MSAPDPGDLFGNQVQKSVADRSLEILLEKGVIVKRPNVNGAFTWGPENKLAIHVESGIPVDLFATDEDRFFNALFVRTGPADLNKRVATLAKEQGWDWHAYGEGFTRGGGTNSTNRRKVKSEQDVFHHVGLDYLDPWER
jgi:DNA polymerase/3'-5' exonuclease PolX